MKKWYVVATRTAQEERAYQNLLRLNVVTYYPTFFTETVRKGHRKIDEHPLFPGYLFVNVDADINSVSIINGTRGVKRIVTFGDFLAFVDDDVISTIIEQLKQGAELLGPELMTGEEVEIKKGIFTGFKALFLEKDGESRSMMLIDLLGRKAKASIPNENL